MLKSCSMITFALVVVGGFVADLQAAPDSWDERLDDICDLYLEDVSSSVATGNYYWRLKTAEFEDESESGGEHHIWYRCQDESGDPIEGQKVWASWPYTTESDSVYQFTKGAADSYYGNFPMYGGCPESGCGWPYNAWVDTTAGPSDKVWGMGLTNPEGSPCNAHVCYRFTWQWTQKGGGGSAPEITLNPTTLAPSTQVGGSPDSDTFTVTNSGDGTLSYSITDNKDWLSVSPTSGTSTGESDTITVTYSTSSLTKGTYYATVTVTDPSATNTPQTLSVTLSVSDILSNEDFEGGFYNDPDVDHKSGNSWHRFSLSGSSKAGPHYSTGNPSPNYAQTIYESSWVAGIYQQCSASSGHTYEASVYAKGTNSEVKLWVGIDPAGGADATAGGITWCSEATPGDTWTKLTAEAEATSSTVTLFLKAQNTQGYNLYAYFDDAALVDKEQGPPPDTGTISGTVKDTSNDPIEGAIVETLTGGYETTTNASGEYTLSNVVVGTYDVMASKAEDYDSDTAEDVVVTKNTTTTQNFTLSQATSFDGLDNGDLEDGFYNDPDADHKVADDWHKFVLSGSPKHTGHWDDTGNHSAVYSQSFYESSYVAGIYQQVSGTTDGKDYTASVWVKGSNEDPRFWIGIDPKGSTNPSSGDIEWSSQSNPGTTWTQISKQVEADGSTVTVFLKVQNPIGSNRVGYFDDAAIVAD